MHLYSHVQACRALECELLAVVGTGSVVVCLTDSRCVCVSVIETEESVKGGRRTAGGKTFVDS